jgi:hypothetical protein
MDLKEMLIRLCFLQHRPIFIIPPLKYVGAIQLDFPITEYLLHRESQTNQRVI